MLAKRVVVLSGKGGTGKTLVQVLMAGEASCLGRRVLLMDCDPERNLSSKFRAPSHTGGLAHVLVEAGVTTGELNVDRGAAAVDDQLVATKWANVDLLPGGASLQGVSQVTIPDTWLLADIVEAAKLPERYDVILIDTGGRTGALTTTAMYAAEVAFAPVMPSQESIDKAREASERVDKIQRAHKLRWAGVVLTGFDGRVGVNVAMRAIAMETFGDQVRAEIPLRAAVQEANQLVERMSDRRDAESQGLARVFRGFLLRDLLQQSDSTIQTEGVITP